MGRREELPLKIAKAHTEPFEIVPPVQGRCTKRGDYVHKGESLATFYGAADKFEAAAAEYRSGLVYGAEKPEEAPLVYALVTKDGVERY